MKAISKIFGKIIKTERELELISDHTKQGDIGEILEKAPEKAEILLNAGMHCLGCIAASGETIAEACEVHGIDVDELIEELNK